MHRSFVALLASLLCLSAASVTLAAPAAALGEPGAGEGNVQPMTPEQARNLETTLPRSGRTVVPSDQRSKILGAGYSASDDIAWTTSGDGAGVHVFAATEKSGYAWSEVATLVEPELIDGDIWISNACAAATGHDIVLTYAPRKATNKPVMMQRGGFAATVNLITGAVKKIAVPTSLAYFSPGCGNTGTTAFTAFGAEGSSKTLITEIAPSNGLVVRRLVLPGSLLSATPLADGFVGVDGNSLVHVSHAGIRRVMAVGQSLPSNVLVDRQGGVAYVDHSGEDARVMYVTPSTVHAIASSDGETSRVQFPEPTVIGTGKLSEVDLQRSAQGTIYLTAGVKPIEQRSPGFIFSALPKGGQVSTLGHMLLHETRTHFAPPEGAGNDRTVMERSAVLRGRFTQSGTGFEFVVTPQGAQAADSAVSHPILDKTQISKKFSVLSDGNDPTDSGRLCAISRNDVNNQVMQPRPRQVEWAVNQATSGQLNVVRPANWKNYGLPTYSPQGMFPPLNLDGGGLVPSSIMLAVIAQESNMWQASEYAMPGVTANPMVGLAGYYGLKYDGDGNIKDWNIDFSRSDCGYGLTQQTDGMRNGALAYNEQRAIAVDYAANIAAGLRTLQSKWNETRQAGLVANDGRPDAIENWFYATWAYNSGFHPKSSASSNDGAWGVGWTNNPASGLYPSNRKIFNQDPSDAAHPQHWPYPEKIIGWAANPIRAVDTDIEKPVVGFNAASWNGGPVVGIARRDKAKPPENLFCNESNQCKHPTLGLPPANPAPPSTPSPSPGRPPRVGVILRNPSGACQHKNASGLVDDKCWFHEPATWKPDCKESCGTGSRRFDPPFPEQPDGAAYPPVCDTSGLPNNALIIDDTPDNAPMPRPGCNKTYLNSGTFEFKFGKDSKGMYTSKIDLHQVGAGRGGHFWFSHTHRAGVRQGSMKISGTWKLNRTIQQWARVLVHMPELGAHTQQARYEIDLGDGVRNRVALQKVMANKWVSLGVFPFKGAPKVTLTNETLDGDADEPTIENPSRPGKKMHKLADVAFDAVAFQLLPKKPEEIIVSLGDSYSSGEGASSGRGDHYFTESDIDGMFPYKRNACHRSKMAWSRLAKLPMHPSGIGAESDNFAETVEHQLHACSGAITHDMLPESVLSGPAYPEQHSPGATQYSEVRQIDKGYLDQDTTLVTLSIGGNDARFADVLQKCVFVVIHNCGQVTMNDVFGDEKLDVALPKHIRGAVAQSVGAVLSEVKRRAPNARIVLMGYPRIFAKPKVNCESIWQDDAEWMNRMVDVMDQMLADLVKNDVRFDKGRVTTFIDPRGSFGNTGACGDTPSIHGIISPVDRTPGEAAEKNSPPTHPSQQSFHPNLVGSKMYADAFEAFLVRRPRT